MTNDEIERRANQIVTNWRQDSAVCESISLVNYVRAAIHLAVTAALEEAAKVADKEALRSSKQAERSERDVHGWKCRVVAAQAIGDAIRALIPSTGTKE